MVSLKYGQCGQCNPMNGCEGDAHNTADLVARRSYGKLVAFLTARTRDVAAAEDALSEAFASALTDWPRNGCPENPEAWLMTVARRKAIDVARKRFTCESGSRAIADSCRGVWKLPRQSGAKFRTAGWPCCSLVRIQPSMPPFARH